MRRLHKVVTLLLVLSMLVTSVVATAVAADEPATEQEATTAVLTSPVITALLPGGQFAKIWLGLTPTTLREYVTVTAEWDRDNPRNSGLGFFVLRPSDLQAVQNGGSLQANNLASGAPVFQAAGNVQGTRFLADGSDFTLVLYNDSADDANVKVTVSNGTLRDDSGQVTDPNAMAESTPAAEAPAAEAAPVAETAATTATATTTDTAATTTVTTTAATTETVAAATPAATTAVVSTEPFVLRAEQVQGSLPELNAQHFLGLEPKERDGEIKLTLTYDPQDNSELSRRLNFWVLDNAGFNLFVAGTNASEVAIAAGNRTFSGQSNERVATFQATGFGPYTVIVYNNSQVPATYSLTSTGATLVDDSLQTTTAQEQAPAGGIVAAAGTTTTTTATAPAATATTATTGTTAATTAATTARAGEPGGTYTVASGDTIALIARDIYGDFSLYAEICAFNNIADCARIEIGDVIKLPTLDQISSGAVSTTTVASTAAATPAATPAAAATTAATTTTTTTTTAATTPAATPAATPTKAATTSTAAGNTIVDVATADGNFTILVKALTNAGLADDLAGAGPFTVFAPTDAAFNALGAATVDALLKDTAKLRQVLLFHVVASEVPSSALEDGLEVKTMQGGSVGFDLSGATPKVQDSLIIVPDVAADNGVIHVIDKVMLP